MQFAQFLGKPSTTNQFDGPFQQKIGPLYAPNGPTLSFEVNGDRTNFISLQNLHLEVKSRIVKADNTVLNYLNADASHRSKTNQFLSTIPFVQYLELDCDGPRSKSLF